MSGSNETLLTRAQVIAELAETAKGDNTPSDTFKAGLEEMAETALALVRRLAPEGVDVDALATEMTGVAVRIERLPVWNGMEIDEDRVRSLVCALILKHVRPVAEPVPVQRCPVCEGTGVVGWPPGVPADVRTTVDGTTTAYPCPLCAGARVISLPAATRQPCAGCRAVLDRADVPRGVMPNVVSAPGTCGLRPRTTAST